MKPPAIRITFDCVVLSVLERKLHVALGRRNPVNEVGDADPFPNAYSLHGSYVRDDEAIADTIRRRLGPEIGLALNPVPLAVLAVATDGGATVWLANKTPADLQAASEAYQKNLQALSDQMTKLEQKASKLKTDKNL